MKRETPVLFLCPWCWYQCYYKFSEGQPRQSTNNERCQCVMPGCQHGQEYVGIRVFT